MKRIISDHLNQFLILLFTGLFIFPDGSFSQATDKRTYAEINSGKNKNVVDYFLLCPDIFFENAGDEYPPHMEVITPKVEHSKLSETASDNALEFRKGLIKLNEINLKVKIGERIIDIKNGYIKITGSDIIARNFEITFTIFEQPGKIIPALTYHSSATEDHFDDWVFYDISNNNWKPINEPNFLPLYSLSDFKAVISEESINMIPKERINWKLELPRYGTTVKIIPFLNYMELTLAESSKLESLYQQFENYVLECSWLQQSGRFSDPVMTLYDKTILPKSGNITASSAFIILPCNAFNNFTATISVNVRKDLLNKKKVETEGLIYEVNSVSMNFIGVNISTKSPVPSNEELKIAFMGSSKNSDLFAVVARNEQSQDFKIWTIARDNGVATSSQIYPFPLKADFYKTISETNGKEPYFSFTIDGSSIKVEMDVWQSREEIEPDYYLIYKWNGSSWDVKKTAKTK